jgi:nucleoside 2-deoxyribosyltransferase
MRAVYLSGPITGLTYKQARCGWRYDVAQLLKDTGIQVLSPMRHEGHLAELKNKTIKAHMPEPEYNHFFSLPKMIVAKDFLDIDMSDIMLVNFLGAKKVSQGTISEMGYAYGKGKTIITVMEPKNVHDSVFVKEMSDAVVDNMDDAVHIIQSLLSEGV